MKKGRLSKLLRMLRSQAGTPQRGEHAGLPFTQEEFAALLHSHHPRAMKTLAEGLARNVDVSKPAPRHQSR